MGDPGRLAPNALNPTLLRFYGSAFRDDEEFLRRAEQAIGISGSNISFREDIVEAVAWARAACVFWPDHQPPEFLKQIASRCTSTADSLLMTAQAMEGMPIDFFGGVPGKLRDYANWLRIGIDSASVRCRCCVDISALARGTRKAGRDRRLHRLGRAVGTGL